jgi:hypothetical protein
MLRFLRWVVVTLGLVATGGTALSFSRNQHWFVRLWDFPRVQLALTGTLAGALFARFFARRKPADHALLATTAAAVAWQLYKIRPYTRLARVTVQRSSRSGGQKQASVARQHSASSSRTCGWKTSSTIASWM